MSMYNQWVHSNASTIKTCAEMNATYLLKKIKNNLTSAYHFQHTHVIEVEDLIYFGHILYKTSEILDFQLLQNV